MSRLLTILESVIGSFVKEALTSAQKKKVGQWEKGSNSHTDKFFGGPDTDKKTHQRRYFDFTPESDSPARAQVENHFAKHGLEVKDYRGGIVTDKIGRPVSIGRKLRDTKADPELIQQFENDPARQSKKEEGLKIVISRHPHDVAGMTSRGQSWCGSSCMNFETGSNRHYLERDLEHGTHVAYLVRHDDRGHPQKPIARVAIKRHEDGKGNSIFVPEDRVYGEAPDGFQQRVRELLDRKHNDSQPSGDYTKNSEVYHDSGSRTAFNVGQDFEGEHGLKSQNVTIRANTIRTRGQAPHIDAAFDNDEHPEVLIAALQNKNHRTRHVERALAHPHDEVRYEAAKSIWAMPEQLEKAFDSDRSEAVKGAALANPSARRSLLQKGLEADKSTGGNYFTARVLENPNLDETHLEHILKNSKAESNNFSKAVQHRKMKKPHLFDVAMEQISKARDEKNDIGEFSGYEYLSKNKNIPARHISTILQHKPEYHRYRTYQQMLRNLTDAREFNDDHIDGYLQSPFPEPIEKNHLLRTRKGIHSRHVQYAVDNNLTGILSNPEVSLNDDQIHTLLSKNHYVLPTEKDPAILQIARLPNLSSEHKARLMSHENAQVRKALWSRSDLTREDFADGINHRDKKTRFAAWTSKHLPKDMIDTLLTDPNADQKTVKHVIKNNPNFGPDHVTTLLNHVRKTDTGFNRLDDIPEKHITQNHIRQSFDLSDYFFRRFQRRGGAWDEETLDAAVSHPNDAVREKAAYQNNLNKSHIEKLSNDSNREVKQILIRRFREDNQLLQKLAKDSDRRVRDTATFRLVQDSPDGKKHFDNFMNDPRNHEKTGTRTANAGETTNASDFLTYRHHLPRIFDWVFSGPHDYLKKHLMLNVNTVSQITGAHLDSVFKGDNQELKDDAINHPYLRKSIPDEHLQNIVQKGTSGYVNVAKNELARRQGTKSKLQESKTPKVATFDPIEESIRTFISKR